jgi:hypothetical protein
MFPLTAARAQVNIQVMPLLYRTALAVLVALAAPTLLRADDVLHVGAVAVDRPTLVALGVQLMISGDDDHDAQVSVRYRPVGAPTWTTGMDLQRVRSEHVGGRVVAAQFAGSIFDLAPATPYEIELRAIDADGLVDQTLTTAATTRTVPGDPASPVVISVTTAAQLQAALNAAQPGHVITLQPGIYRGPFELSASGTAANPIVVRGADQDGVVLDGNRCACNLFEITGSFIHVENLTAQNALRAIRLKGTATTNNVLRRVRLRDVTNAIIGDLDQRDFYLCDNVLEGRLVWPAVYGNDGGRHANDDGINVQGDGHVVCHNQIVGFGDAMKNEGIGARADDFYGNEVLSAYDNGLEFDFSEGNVRAFRNRFTNTFVPLSFQPVYGGPVYALRNVMVNVAEDQLKLYTIGGVQQPSGVLVLHNTFVSPEQTLLMGSSEPSHDITIENNLFVGPDPGPQQVVTWIGNIDNGVIDWNGWSPDGEFDFGGAGSWADFAAMQAGGVFESHGTLLSAGTFANGLTPPASYTVTVAPQDVTLASDSNAIDAARVLPNVNDDATGVAPDLGALERGCPLPLYGVRPTGIDDSNEPTGCGGPTVTTTTLPYATIQTSSLKLKDTGNPANRRLAFKSSTTRDPQPHRIVPPAFGSSGDPTLHGAVVTVYNAANGTDIATVVLPAAGWLRLGTAGYSYRSPSPTAAISSAKVQADRMQLKGGRASFTYTLDEPAQQRVAVRLALGSDRYWCAAALGRVKGTPPSPAKNDRVGLFVAQPGMAAPLTCPPTP